jgi:hypothetical protein
MGRWSARVVRAARAVDTATDPDLRRQGLFRSLTLDALESLRADGTRLVWNTPNAASLSGYLTMGWQEIGRLPVAVLPASARFPLVVATARRAAGRDAVATSFGRAAWDVLGGSTEVDALVVARPAPVAGLTTRTTQDFLAWRYNNPALGYRVLLAGATPASGLVVFRLRRRGRAIEAVLCDQLVPDSATGDDLVRSLARGTPADYVIRIPDGVTRGRFIRLPRTGPVLACRVLDGPDGLEELVPPALGEWALTMGDVELL